MPDMKPEELELLRRDVLLQLHDARPHAVTVRTLHIGTSVRGFTATLGEVTAAADYLTRKGWAQAGESDMSRVVRTWAITDEGVKVLDDAGYL